MWLGRAILQGEQPFHPFGLLHAGPEGGRAVVTGSPRQRYRPMRDGHGAGRPDRSGSRFLP